MTVTIQDVRALNYCSRGAREFCEKKGLSWDKLLREGLTYEELRAGGEDAMVERLIQQAEQRNAIESGG
ncbi:hypothetical protein [Methylovulum miyakonense]|uniref:hypothetical protein n=1 Tax=Methylovulum miyakonense TaxID=645578 RepID=UPI0003792B04|nr:hypothetical protein [Methylovulum miyakonense]